MIVFFFSPWYGGIFVCSGHSWLGSSSFCLVQENLDRLVRLYILLKTFLKHVSCSLSDIVTLLGIWMTFPQMFFFSFFLFFCLFVFLVVLLIFIMFLVMLFHFNMNILRMRMPQSDNAGICSNALQVWCSAVYITIVLGTKS